MNFRRISPMQAYAIQKIIADECGYVAGECDDFRRSITTEGKPDEKIVHEFRFCGSLGFGGKFYNNGNNDNTPYVGCYPQDETQERKAKIARANERIAQLFKGAPMNDTAESIASPAAEAAQPQPWAALPEGEYAILELFGHTTLVGRIEEVERFGSKMLAIQVMYAGQMLPAVYHGGAAIYRLTPCSPEVAWKKQPKEAHVYSLPATIRAIVPPLLLESQVAQEATDDPVF